jgi:outer membrane protease
MKNITALTILVIIINCTNLYSQNRNYSFWIGPQFGFIYGGVFEYVYPVDTKGEFLSKLDWDVKPVYYYGFKAEYGLFDPMRSIGFYASMSFKAGFPGISGNMEDRDWQSIENAELTNYSSHTNKTGEFYRFDADIGLSIPVKNYCYVKPIISGTLMFFSFTAADGEGKYAREKTPYSNTYYPIDDNPRLYSFTGDVLNYSQYWLLAAPGITVGKKIRNTFELDASFLISPLSFCTGIDEHIERKLKFTDYTRWGLYVEQRLRAVFTGNRYELSLDAAFCYISKTRGETYIQDAMFTYPADSEGGASLSFMDIGLNAKIFF